MHYYVLSLILRLSITHVHYIRKLSNIESYVNRCIFFDFLKVEREDEVEVGEE